MPLRCHTSSAAATRAVAAVLASQVRAGDLIVLTGDLGAGKTTFTQGFGRALGIAEQITSPTFTLLRTYGSGRLVLHHLDVYRLDQLAEVVDLGLAELFDDGSVVVIEWGDAIRPVLPNDHLIVELRLGETDDDRILEFTDAGSTWGARLTELASVVTPGPGVSDSPDPTVAETPDPTAEPC